MKQGVTIHQPSGVDITVRMRTANHSGRYQVTIDSCFGLVGPQSRPQSPLSFWSAPRTQNKMSGVVCKMKHESDSCLLNGIRPQQNWSRIRVMGS